ncbi:MAG: hypothetical protein ABL908_04455, partial [Hyphomicrobium sp.]
MAITQELMLAILAMDSYNRDYGAGVVVDGTQIGTAILGANSSVLVDAGGGRVDQAASFFAQAYTWNGRTVISYRGTDVLPGVTDPFFELSSWRDVTSWSTFLNNHFSSAQHELAAQFYQSVVTASGGNPIETTGHSLGGALAGFVAGTYGLSASMFDNISFIADVKSLFTAVTDGVPSNVNGDLEIDSQALQRYFDGAAPVLPPSFPGSRFAGYYLNGEVAALARTSEENQLLARLSFADDAGLGNVALHSQALLVIGLFFQQSSFANGSGWPAFRKEIIERLADESVSTAIGLKQSVTGRAAAGDQLQTLIAYSALDDGERPFGDSAIRALFDDADDLGRLVGGSGLGQVLGEAAIADAVKAALAGIIVQHAGDLAFAKNFADAATDGVVTVPEGGGYLEIDLDPTRWTSTFATEAKRIVGLEALAKALRLQLIAAEADAAVKAPLTAALDEFVAGLKRVTRIAAATADIAFVDGADAARAHDGTPGGAILVGAEGAQSITGSAGSDLVIGGDGNDVVYRTDGGTGADLYLLGDGIDSYAFADIDVGDGSGPRSPTGKARIFGGDGEDVADYSEASQAILIQKRKLGEDQFVLEVSYKDEEGLAPEALTFADTLYSIDWKGTRFGDKLDSDEDVKTLLQQLGEALGLDLDLRFDFGGQAADEPQPRVLRLVAGYQQDASNDVVNFSGLGPEEAGGVGNGIVFNLRESENQFVADLAGAQPIVLGPGGVVGRAPRDIFDALDVLNNIFDELITPTDLSTYAEDQRLGLANFESVTGTDHDDLIIGADTVYTWVTPEPDPNAAPDAPQPEPERVVDTTFQGYDL